MRRSAKKYSLLLVNPGRRRRYQWDLQEVCELMGKKTPAHPLALPLLAALTPDRYDVSIVDEEIAPLDRATTADLVGITALYSNVARGYEIADRFRSAGVPVVMGGPQVSFAVEETLRHADCVVVGEAEGVWLRVLEDFEAGALRPVYRASEPCEYRTSPMPRWDLVDTSKVMTMVVQVSRGCPNRCKFCVVSALFGKRQRYRDVDDVVREIESLPVEEVAFADDNLLADRAYARELLEKLEPLGISWTCQSSVEVGLDAELVDSMARAGCRSVLVGFESVSDESLKEARKTTTTTAQYREAVATIHRAGIHVIASFLVGFDADTLDTFDRIAEFVEETELSFVMINSLSPYRGTALHRSLERQGRNLDLDIDELVLFYPLMVYKSFSQEALCARGLSTLRRLYSYGSLRRKGPAVLGNGAFRHDDGAHVTAAAKVRSSINLARSHLVTGDRDKRRLFLELFDLVKEQRASPGDVVRYLLFMESLNGFLRYAEEQMPAAIEHIRDRVARASC